MYKRLKEQWVEALRSGKYHRCYMYLKAENIHGTVCHCAVGVLAEILKVKWHKEGTVYYPSELEGAAYYLKDDFLKIWAGVTDYELDVIEKVMNMNDNRCSFEEIANFIEKEL